MSGTPLCRVLRLTPITRLTVNADDMDTLLDLRMAKKIYVGERQLTLEQHVDVQRRFSELRSASS